MIRFKEDSFGYDYVLEGFFTKDGKWTECEPTCGLCIEGVRNYVGRADYVCFAEKPPAYAKSEAYKIKLERSSGRLSYNYHYYLRFLDTVKSRRVQISSNFYSFLYHGFFKEKVFYGWGEYADLDRPAGPCRFRVELLNKI